MSTPATSLTRSRSFITRLSYIWMQLANQPFLAFYILLPFILRKDLHASTLQITIFSTLQPVISVFSFYWGANLLRQRTKLLPNLMGAWVLARLPFLCLPFVDNVWFLIGAAGCYQLFYRAGIPALMEILKLNTGKEKREKLFSHVFVLSFIESIVLGVFLGKLLDMNTDIWKTLFCISALLSITSIFIQMRIPLPSNLKPDENTPPITTNRILQPIKDTLYLMRSRPDFAKFQWGFMIGGFGLMLIHPILTIFYVDVLALSHDQIAFARYICMGIGVTGTTFLWRRSLKRFSLNHITAFIILGFSLFPLILLIAKINLFWVNIAFVFYGIAQAGSHLVWHLSGTLFAKEEDSSKFSAVNILTVGIRGLIGPGLGGILCSLFGPVFVLILGFLICVLGMGYMFSPQVSLFSRKKPLEPA